MLDASRYTLAPGGDHPPVIVGGQGVYLYTDDGRRILDGCAGAIVGNIGWGRPEPAAAAQQAMAEGGYVVPIWATRHRLDLIERLTERWLPEGFDRVFLTSGGSESTDSAMRLARTYQLAMGRPERWKIVGRHPSFHGMTLGTIAVASHAGRRAGFEPMLVDFPKVPWDDPAAVVEVIEREDPGTIAGFLAEPIIGAAGACLSASDEYWETVTDLCRRHDIVLMADEVMCGYGRTGTTWGHQHTPMEPDVIVGGKGLGGGYVPMGAVAASRRITDALGSRQLMFFTFCGADAACAASSVVLDILESEQLVERAATLGTRLGAALRAELGNHSLVADVRGRGMFYGVELRCPAAAVVAETLRRDLFVYPAGTGADPVPQAVMVAPPFVVDEAELDDIVSRLGDALDEIAARRP